MFKRFAFCLPWLNPNVEVHVKSCVKSYYGISILGTSWENLVWNNFFLVDKGWNIVSFEGERKRTCEFWIVPNVLTNFFVQSWFHFFSNF